MTLKSTSNRYITNNNSYELCRKVIEKQKEKLKISIHKCLYYRVNYMLRVQVDVDSGNILFNRE